MILWLKGGWIDLQGNNSKAMEENVTARLQEGRKEGRRSSHLRELNIVKDPFGSWLVGVACNALEELVEIWPGTLL